MGNNTSSLVSSLDNEDIQLKAGKIEEGLPLSDTFETFESLILSPRYKEFLLNNLDSNYLADILINADDSQLLNKLDCFRSYTEDELTLIQTDMDHLNSCALSGVNVSMPVTH